MGNEYHVSMMASNGEQGSSRVNNGSLDKNEGPVLVGRGMRCPASPSCPLNFAQYFRCGQVVQWHSYEFRECSGLSWVAERSSYFSAASSRLGWIQNQSVLIDESIQRIIADSYPELAIWDVNDANLMAGEHHATWLLSNMDWLLWTYEALLVSSENLQTVRLDR